MQQLQRESVWLSCSVCLFAKKIEIRDSGEKVLFIMDDVDNYSKEEARSEKLLCRC